MNEDHQDVLDKLSLLTPGPQDAPRPARQALAQLNNRLPRRQSWATRLSRLFFAPQRQWATAVATLIVVFGIAFAFPGFRAAASDFLGLFRVQKFTAVSISPDQIAILQEVAELGIMPGEVEITEEPGELQPVATLSEAQNRTGMTAVHTLPTLGSPSQIAISSGGSGQLTIDLEGARAILAAAGLAPDLLPDNLDNARVMVAIFAGVQQQWDSGVTLLQTESPVVEYPDDLDPVVLGEALLQLLGMDALQAERLAARIDWTSTLLLPIPQDIASFNEVTVNGDSALALTSLNGSGGVLLWQQNGIVHLLIGARQSTFELIELAESMR